MEATPAFLDYTEIMQTFYSIEGEQDGMRSRPYARSSVSSRSEDVWAQTVSTSLGSLFYARIPPYHKQPDNPICFSFSPHTGVVKVHNLRIWVRNEACKRKIHEFTEFTPISSLKRKTCFLFYFHPHLTPTTTWNRLHGVKALSVSKIALAAHLAVGKWIFRRVHCTLYSSENWKILDNWTPKWLAALLFWPIISFAERFHSNLNHIFCTDCWAFEYVCCQMHAFVFSQLLILPPAYSNLTEPNSIEKEVSSRKIFNFNFQIIISPLEAAIWKCTMEKKFY